MGLTKKSRITVILCAAILSLAGGALYSQNNVPMQLGTEIQQLEQRLSTSVGRYEVLVRLAQLRQLSGNIAGAAVNWLDAAAVNPNDDTALVSGAYCLAAIGEWERAAAALRPVLVSNRVGPALLQARFLDACLRAWTSNTADGISDLAAIAVNPEFIALRPIIYYTLWQTLARNTSMPGANNANDNGAESWKSLLLAEFPKSPEARAANPEKQKDLPSVSA